MNTKPKLLGYFWAALIIAAMLMYKVQCNRADAAETRAATAEVQIKRLEVKLKSEREYSMTWINNYMQVWDELDTLRKATKEASR